jgi:hypothetical protein
LLQGVENLGILGLNVIPLDRVQVVLEVGHVHAIDMQIADLFDAVCDHSFDRL